MNVYKVLLGAILIKPDLAPYSLPDLEIEHFPADLQPVFAALSGLWNAKGQLDAVEACARYPEQKAAILECVQECENECVHLTRDHVREWTQLVREQAALTQFQSLALQAGSSLTTFADLPDLYGKMGEALTLDREEQDFKPIGELVDNYIRRLDEKTEYVPTGIAVLDRNLHLSPGNLFIIGGRTSAGKTALSLQMACEQARRSFRVCYFSLETDPDTLTARIIANRLAVPLADVKAKTVPQSDLDDLAELHKLPLYIHDNPCVFTKGQNLICQPFQADSIVRDIDRCLHNFTHGPENSHRALAFGHIDTNSVHLKYLLIDKIHGDRFYSLPVQSPGRLHERTERRWDNLLKSNAANERGG